MQQFIRFIKRWLTPLPEPEVTKVKHRDNDQYILGIKLWRW